MEEQRRLSGAGGCGTSEEATVTLSSEGSMEAGCGENLVQMFQEGIPGKTIPGEWDWEGRKPSKRCHNKSEGPLGITGVVCMERGWGAGAFVLPALGEGRGIPQHCGWSALGWGGIGVSGCPHTASERNATLALESGHVLGALCKKTFQGLEGIRHGTGRRPLERAQFVEPRAGNSLGSRAGTGHRLALQGA